MGGGWMYHMFGRGGRDLGGIFTKPAEMPGPPAWCHYIMVDGVDAAAERVKAAGGQIINGPMEVPGGDWIAQGIDPQGAMFAVHGKR
jgi:predicted enzyme related to lactoylglutathione lyase